MFTSEWISEFPAKYLPALLPVEVDLHSSRLPHHLVRHPVQQLASRPTCNTVVSVVRVIFLLKAVTYGGVVFSGVYSPHCECFLLRKGLFRQVEGGIVVDCVRKVFVEGRSETLMRAQGEEGVIETHSSLCRQISAEETAFGTLRHAQPHRH